MMKIRHILTIVLTGALLPAAAQAQASQTTAATEKPYLTLAQLRAKYRDPRGKIMTIGGVEVYYKDEGRGPVVLLIHGSVSSLKTWDGVASRLVKDYRVIRFDIPPQGQSGPVPDSVLATMRPVDLTEQLLTRLGVTKATVVGVSSGGTMGVQLAAKRPDMVERLVLSNAPANPVTTGHQVMTPEFEAALAESKRLNFQTLSYWQAFLTYYAGDPARFSPQFVEQIYDMNRRVPEKNIIALVAKVADHEAAVKAMNAVKAPTLLIWGGRDQLLPFSAMDTLAAYLKSAEISKLLLPDVGHYPPMEVPERYAALVRAYIESATPRIATSGN